MAPRKPAILLVSGSRSWEENRRSVVEEALSAFRPGTWLLHGGQKRRVHGSTPMRWAGVDYLVDMVGIERGWVRIIVPYISGLGNAGGPRRNVVMVVIASALAAQGHEVAVRLFHDNIAESRGTAHMRNVCDQIGLRYEVVTGE